MPDEALRQLKEWLFVNVMVACVNYRADLMSANLLPANQLSANQAPMSALSAIAPPAALEKPGENSALVNWMRHELEPTAPADYTSILTALAAVEREVDSLGSDLDGALQLLALQSPDFHPRKRCGDCVDGRVEYDFAAPALDRTLRGWGRGSVSVRVFLASACARDSCCVVTTRKPILWSIAKAAVCWVFVP